MGDRETQACLSQGPQEPLPSEDRSATNPKTHSLLVADAQHLRLFQICLSGAFLSPFLSVMWKPGPHGLSPGWKHLVMALRFCHSEHTGIKQRRPPGQLCPSLLRPGRRRGAGGRCAAGNPRRRGWPSERPDRRESLQSMNVQGHPSKTAKGASPLKTRLSKKPEILRPSLRSRGDFALLEFWQSGPKSQLEVMIYFKDCTILFHRPSAAWRLPARHWARVAGASAEEVAAEAGRLATISK